MGRATGFEDKTQGTLFFDVCRILKEKRPKAFMLENVKNLCSHDKGRTFQVIRESLEELDYEIFYKVLDGQNYVPQHRERLQINTHCLINCGHICRITQQSIGQPVMGLDME